MARNLKWRIPFVSRNGTECHIDIYKDKYEDSTVTVISRDVTGTIGYAAPNPIEWEEDNDKDLLKYIRVKSGYIRLIEASSGSLSDLYPQLNTDHYVRFYYGKTLMFTGYMKAQMFENEFLGDHREIDFPIVSPLGLVDGIFFEPEATPSFKTLGQWITYIINGLDGNINKVWFPDPTPTATYSLMSMILNSLVICKRSGIEVITGTKATELFEGESYNYLLEGICAAYDLILHDEPNAFVFQKIGYTGTYKYVQRGASLIYGQERKGNVSGDTVEKLDTTSVSPESTESIVLPKSKIDVSCDGEFFSSVSLPYCSCRKSTNGGSYDGTDYALLVPINDEIHVNDNVLIKSGGVNGATGRLSSPGIMLGYGGGDVIIIQKGTDFETGMAQVKVTFYEIPYYSFHIVYNGQFGSTLKDNDSGQSPTVSFIVKNGSYYWNGYNGNNQWQNESSARAYGNFKGENSIYVGALPDRKSPLELTIETDLQYLDANKVYSINGLQLQDNDRPVLEYVYGRQSPTKTVKGVPSNEYGMVQMAFSSEWLTSNYLTSPGASTSIPDVPVYTQMFSANNRLVLIMRGSLPGNIYLKQYSYWIYKGWRVIAVGANPWDDEYTLTLQRTS